MGNFLGIVRTRWILMALTCAGLSAGALSAPKSTPGRFSPTFQVAPLVHQFEASPGAVINFSFQVTSPGTGRTIQIQPVGMIQQETGQVLPDESRTEFDVIRMISPERMELRADRPYEIRGRLTVPNNGSSFQAYGLLITDLGPPGSARKGPADGGKQLAVNFVTRYLLRIEVMVRGVRSESARRLEMTAARLRDVGGRAVAEAMVVNPTGTAFEFEAHCQLLRDDGVALGPPFKLAMPVRTNVTDRRRYRSRVLGDSRVRVHAPVPEPIMPGAYRMSLDLLVDGRMVATQSFPMTVSAEQFPAQAAVVAQIVKDVQVSPTQIELSVRPRGSRIVPVKITNTSSRPVTVHLTAAGLNIQDRSLSSAPDWLVIRPQMLTLGPRMSRSAMIALRGADQAQSHSYAALRVEVEPEDGGAGGQRDLLVALLTRDPMASRLSCGELQWDSTDHGAFTIPVRNEANVHIPLAATLTLTDAFGRRLELVGGFGRWLLPGESDVIRFPLEGVLPPGDYKVRGQIAAGEGAEPIRISHRFTADGAGALAAQSLP